MPEISQEALDALIAKASEAAIAQQTPQLPPAPPGLDQAAVDKMIQEAVAQSNQKLSEQMAALAARPTEPSTQAAESAPQDLSRKELDDADIDAFLALPRGSAERRAAEVQLKTRAAYTPNPLKRDPVAVQLNTVA